MCIWGCTFICQLWCRRTFPDSRHFLSRWLLKGYPPPRKLDHREPAEGSNPIHLAPGQSTFDPVTDQQFDRAEVGESSLALLDNVATIMLHKRLMAFRPIPQKLLI